LLALPTADSADATGDYSQIIIFSAKSSSESIINFSNVCKKIVKKEGFLSFKI